MKGISDALVNDAPAAFEKEYGYLEPARDWRDGVNGWRRLFDIWRPLGVKEYSVSFDESIVTVAGNTAIADLDGVETILRSGVQRKSAASSLLDIKERRKVHQGPQRSVFPGKGAK